MHYGSDDMDLPDVMRVEQDDQMDLASVTTQEISAS